MTIVNMVGGSISENPELKLKSVDLITADNTVSIQTNLTYLGSSVSRYYVADANKTHIVYAAGLGTKIPSITNSYTSTSSLSSGTTNKDAVSVAPDFTTALTSLNDIFINSCPEGKTYSGSVEIILTTGSSFTYGGYSYTPYVTTNTSETFKFTGDANTMTWNSTAFSAGKFYVVPLSTSGSTLVSGTTTPRGYLSGLTVTYT